MQEIMNLWKVCRTSSTLMNLTLHDVDGGYRKRECQIKTEKYSLVLQLFSEPSQDVAESGAQKIQRIQKIRMQTSRKQRECHVLQKKNGHVESNDRSQVHDEEEGKRETVFDLVNAWNDRTAEVLDV